MKRSLIAPVVGLGVGAAALGGAGFIGTRAQCAEGRVVESLAQCKAMVGMEGLQICDAAFQIPPAQERLDVVDRAAFVRLDRNGLPTAEHVTRAGGDPKWRNAAGSVMDPYRNSCGSRSSSSSSGGSSTRSGWSSSSSNSGSNNTSGSATQLTSRGGFGSSGSFASHSSS